MDISSIAKTASTLAEVGISQEVSIAVLKKAQDISKDSAVALIEAIPNASSTANLPPNLGRNINTTA
jgi:hypothetical protein